MASTSSSETGKTRGQRFAGGCFGAIFFGIFFCVGLGVMIMMGLRPLILTAQAQSWIETPCTVTSSKLDAHSGSKGTSYRIDIRYTYGVDGQRFQGDRYNFSVGHSSGQDGKQAVVDEYRHEPNPVCYVNPDQHSEAVLNPDPDWYMLWGLFGLPFFLVGAGGLYGTFIYKSKAKLKGKGAKAKPRTKRAGQTERKATGVSRGDLESASSPFGKFVFFLVFALFWNGVVGTMFYLAVLKDGFDGGFDWLPAIFLSIFLLIGAVLLLLVVPYQFLALFNPTITCRIERGPLQPGCRAQLEWRINGRADRLTKLTITLVGREEATYRQGTNTRTDKRDFLTAELYQDSDVACSGSCELAIPADTMPSFSANNNKIAWVLTVHGDIPSWPDVKHEFPLLVLPEGAP
ncbi:MAG: DUF3592 domain-containing protein [Planctomycetota bacterium]|jgi:hypothetical protein|nr:DUF3592 domain-containing protein [Planctomycetota bacterium]